MDDDKIAFSGAGELAAAFRRRALSPLEAVEVALARIERFEPTLAAFQMVDPDGARESAREATVRWHRGRPASPLDGVPMTLKDIVLTKGWPTLEGSKTVDPTGPWTEDAPCVARLREGGAVFLGKTTTPEFGWKGLTDSPLRGTTRNPWDPNRSPGGSSGGAAAALAAGIGGIAHGTDGGGSIRIPASYCGLVGFKPTFGRVPHYPQTSPYATLSSNGPIARSVADAALMTTVIAQPDARDWLAAPYDGRDYRAGLDDGVRGVRIAYAPGFAGAEPKPEVAAIVGEAVARFAGLGARLEEVGEVVPPLRPVFEDYWLAGLAYRVRGLDAARRSLLDSGLRALAERGERFGLDAYYAAIAARAGLAVAMNRFHETYDLLVTPTMPSAAPPADTEYHGPGFDRWRDATAYTVAFNLTGQPAASLPCGLTSEGLPVGLQIVGPRFHDAAVLRAARAFEKAQEFPRPHPRLLAALGG